MSGSRDQNGSSSAAGGSNSTPPFYQHELFRTQYIPNTTVEKLKLIIDLLNNEHGFHIRKIGKKADLVKKVQDAFDVFKMENQPDNYRRARAAADEVMSPSLRYGSAAPTSSTHAPYRAGSASAGYGVSPSSAAASGAGQGYGYGAGAGGGSHAAGRAYANLPAYQPGMGRPAGYGGYSNSSPTHGLAPFRLGAPLSGQSYGNGNGGTTHIMSPWRETPAWKPVTALTEMQLLIAIDETNTTEKKTRQVAFTIPHDVAAQLVPPTIPMEFPVNPECSLNQYAIEMKKGAKIAGTIAPISLDRQLHNTGNALRKTAGASNVIIFGHTGPSMNKKTRVPKKFYLQVVLTETQTSAEIKSAVLAGPRKSEAEIRASMRKDSREKEEEEGIEMGAIKVSLKDPNVFSRIQIPVRSTLCTHLQCFDLELWISLNEQTPKWTCPTCEKELRQDELFIDGYSEALLKACPDSIDEVLVEPDGEWHSENGKYGSEAWIAAHPPTSAKAFLTSDSQPGSGRESPAIAPLPGRNSSTAPQSEIVMLDDDDDDQSDNECDNPLALLAGRNVSSIPLLPLGVRPINLCSDDDDDDDDDQPLAQRQDARTEPDWSKRLEGMAMREATLGPTVLGKRERSYGTVDDDDDFPGRPNGQRRRIDSPLTGHPASLGDSSSASRGNINVARQTPSHEYSRSSTVAYGFLDAGGDRLAPGLRGGSSTEMNTSGSSGPLNAAAGRFSRIVNAFEGGNRDRARGSPPPAGSDVARRESPRTSLLSPELACTRQESPRTSPLSPTSSSSRLPQRDRSPSCPAYDDLEAHQLLGAFARESRSASRDAGGSETDLSVYSRGLTIPLWTGKATFLTGSAAGREQVPGVTRIQDVMARSDRTSTSPLPNVIEWGHMEEHTDEPLTSSANVDSMRALESNTHVSSKQRHQERSAPGSDPDSKLWDEGAAIMDTDTGGELVSTQRDEDHELSLDWGDEAFFDALTSLPEMELESDNIPPEVSARPFRGGSANHGLVATGR